LAVSGRGSGIGGEPDFAALSGAGVSGAGEGIGAAFGSFGDLAADSLQTARTDTATATTAQTTRVIEASAIIAVWLQT
jgi:hypothetical protein